MSILSQSGVRSLLGFCRGLAPGWARVSGRQGMALCLSQPMRASAFRQPVARDARRRLQSRRYRGGHPLCRRPALLGCHPGCAKPAGCLYHPAERGSDALMRDLQDQFSEAQLIGGDAEFERLSGGPRPGDRRARCLPNCERSRSALAPRPSIGSAPLPMRLHQTAGRSMRRVSRPIVSSLRAARSVFRWLQRARPADQG